MRSLQVGQFRGSSGKAVSNKLLRSLASSLMLSWSLWRQECVGSSSGHRVLLLTWQCSKSSPCWSPSCRSADTGRSFGPLAHLQLHIPEITGTTTLHLPCKGAWLMLWSHCFVLGLYMYTSATGKGSDEQQQGVQHNSKEVRTLL